MQLPAAPHRKRLSAALTRTATICAALALAAHAACSTDAAESPESPSAEAGAGPETGAITSDAAPDGPGSCPDDATKVDCSYATDAGDPGVLPGDLRCTGLYSCWSSKTVSPTALAYKPDVELWSDGAEKSRWLALPAGGKIDISKHDGWVFPVGTKVFKEFKVGGKRLETRIWQKVSGTGPASAGAQWEATVYRWSEDGESSAKRLDTGEIVGDYEIPASSVCIRCHQGREDRLLGIDEWSLSTPDATGLTLAKMKELGLVTPEPTSPTLAIPEDGTGKAAAALGWLNANCGFCHNDDTGSAKGTGLFMNLALDPAGDGGVSSTPVWKTAMNQPLRPTGKFALQPQFAGFLRMRASDSTTSLVPTLDATRADGGIDPNQMPPLLSRKVDPKAASVKAWIDALPP
jgi:hypothetical protein